MNYSNHVGRQCDAFLCAVENERDARQNPTLAELDAIAAGYVADGLAKCTCPSPETREIWRMLDRKPPVRAELGGGFYACHYPDRDGEKVPSQLYLEEKGEAFYLGRFRNLRELGRLIAKLGRETAR